MTLAPPAPIGARIDAPSGPLLFASFAAPPNALGYCGGDDHAALVGHLQAGLNDPGLVALCRAFEGAWPYLELISASAGLPDPLDPRVVEAYWIGNRLLDRVRPADFRADLTARFRGRAERDEWRWLEAKPAAGARPHHSFHVLEVMPRIGLLRAGHIQAVLPAMEQCLVRSATVTGRTPTSALVSVRPLLLSGGRLVLGPAREQELLGAPGDLLVGDRIAIHWARSCGRLSDDQARRLDATTEAALALASETT